MFVFLSTLFFFFFKQKTAYEMRISDWSSDLCSSDLDSLVARVKLLRVRVDLEDLDASRRDALKLRQRRLPIVGVDGCDRQHSRVPFCERDQAIIVRANALRLPLQCMVRTAEPHGTKTGHPLVVRLKLRLIITKRSFAAVQMDMHIERALLRQRRLGSH